MEIPVADRSWTLVTKAKSEWSATSVPWIVLGVGSGVSLALAVVPKYWPKYRRDKPNRLVYRSGTGECSFSWSDEPGLRCTVKAPLKDEAKKKAYKLTRAFARARRHVFRSAFGERLKWSGGRR